MAVLPTVGTNSYNGFEFPSNTETLGYTLRFVLDRSGRTVVAAEHRIALRFVINLAGDSILTSTDTLIDAIKASLGKVGGQLYYKDKGCGDLEVNISTGGQLDIENGPKPLNLSFEHLAGPRAIRVTFEVLTTLPVCADAVYSGQPSEFVFRVSYAIDGSGYTTRRITGFVRVPVRRHPLQSRTFATSADEWREKITPALVPGCRRLPGTFTLSEDRSQLDFEFTDEEVGPNYLPPNTVRGRASHKIRSIGPGMERWAGTISATYETNRQAPATSAYEEFRNLVRQRFEQMRRNANPILTAGNSSQFPRANGFAIPLAFEMEETDVYGKQEASFSLTYQLASSLQNVLRSSGLWTPTNNTWDDWERSLRLSAFNVRGNAGLSFDARRSEVVIDLCRPNKNLTTPPATTPPPDVQLPPSYTGTDDFAVLKPEKKDSWMQYDLHVVSEEDTRVVVHQPLPIKKTTRTIRTEGVLAPVPVPVGQETTTEYPEAKIQTRTAPGLVVYLVGRALRAGYDIDMPVMREIDGVKATMANRPEMGEGYRCAAIGSFGGVTVYAATFNLRFVLPKAPPNRIAALSTPLVAANAYLDANGSFIVPRSLHTP